MNKRKGNQSLGFLATCLLLASMIVGCGKDEQEFTVVEPVPVDELIAQLPEPWNKKTPQVEPEKNGYVYLRDQLNIDHRAVPTASDFEGVSDKEARRLLATVDSWFKVLEITLMMDDWQAPLPDQGVATLFPELPMVKALQQSITRASMVALQDGNTEESVRLLLLSNKFAERQMLAGGSVIHFLVGLAIDAISAKAINEALITGKLSSRQTERLLATTIDPGLYDAAKTALVDEIHGMSAFEISKMEFPKAIDSGLWGESSTDERIQNWERVLREIFIGHPDPFDQLATVTAITEIMDEALYALSLPYGLSSRSVAMYEEKTSLWSSDTWDSDEVLDFLKIGDWSADEVEEVRKKISSEPNPYGQMMIQLMTPVTQSLEVIFFRTRTRWEMTRCILGIRLYEMKFDRLPASLEELVSSGLLDSLPQDHFASEPLQFDREKRIVWSVGRDMVDDNGEGEFYKSDPDMVIPF